MEGESGLVIFIAEITKLISNGPSNKNIIIIIIRVKYGSLLHKQSRFTAQDTRCLMNEEDPGK